jgi:hypothetical protein
MVLAALAGGRGFRFTLGRGRRVTAQRAAALIDAEGLLNEVKHRERLLRALAAVHPAEPVLPLIAAARPFRCGVAHPSYQKSAHHGFASSVP